MRKNVFAVFAVAVLVGVILSPGVGHAEGGPVDRATIESILNILKDLERQVRALDMRGILDVSPVKEIKNSRDGSDNEGKDGNHNQGEKNEKGGWITLPELPGIPRVSCTLPELKASSRKDAVYLLQLALKQDGSYPEGWITGYFGPKTGAGVRAFQKKNGLSETGIADGTTIALLNDLIRGWYPDTCAGVVPPPGQLQKFGGILQLLGPTTQMWGTYRLAGEEGKSEALRGINDETTHALKNAEGKRVYVWGTRDYYPFEGGFWGIIVSKVVVRGEGEESVLRVFSPAEGTTAKAGDSITIRWDGKDFPNPSEFVYRIELTQKETVRILGEVTATSTGELSFGWMVPADLAAGPYRIRVVQLEKVICVKAPCYPVETARGIGSWFTIGATVSGAVFKVTSPAEASEWSIGNSYAIYWDTGLPRTPGGTVTITLGVPFPACLDRNFSCMIAVQAPYTIATRVFDSGSYSWTIGTDIPVWFRDRDVFITVASDQGNSTGTSGRFRIKIPTTAGR